MVTFEINGLEELADKIKQIDLDKLCYDVAKTLQGDIRKRVHVEGKASDGSQIGQYSLGYLKVRANNFQSKKVVRGARKGMPRPVYNRGTDPKVILSLTRQMENDFGSREPEKIDNGYGIGYNNEFNFNKAIWNEERYKKPIWNLTKEEQQTAQNVVHNHLQNLGLL